MGLVFGHVFQLTVGLYQYDICGTVTIVDTDLNQPPLTGDRAFGIVNFIFHTSVEANNQMKNICIVIIKI